MIYISIWNAIIDPYRFICIVGGVVEGIHTEYTLFFSCQFGVYSSAKKQLNTSESILASPGTTTPLYLYYIVQ